MPDVDPKDLCRCDCHDEIIVEAETNDLVRIEVVVRLDDPLETAVACTHCYMWHHRARHQRPRAA